MIQVLISTMHLTDPISLLSKMNIQTGAVIIDQCDYQGAEQISFRNHIIEIYHTTERGLSRSRNMAISKATADIVIFADDDFYYSDTYDKFVCQAYEQLKNADIIVFGAIRSDGYIYRKIPTGRMNRKYRFSINSIRITAKVEALRSKRIFFDTSFGAGSNISGGEDTIFISDCFANNLNIYSCDTILCRGLVAERLSTWFSGYDEKFFENKGSVYKRLSLCYPLFIFYFATKNRKKYINDISYIKAIKCMFKGANNK